MKKLGAEEQVRTPWITVLIGFVAVWLVLDRLAALLGSVRGEAGVVVCLAVVAAACLVEVVLFRRTPGEALRFLGFGRPTGASLTFALALAAALLAFYPLFSAVTGAPITLRDDWPWLSIGLFAQGGIAEEVVFRGYLFHHIREGRSFWRAAALSTLPFVAVHLSFFVSMSFPIALTAVLISLVLSLPFAYLFDRGVNTIWAAAIVHCVVQGSIKLVEVPEQAYLSLAVLWMIVSALAPYLVFVLLLARVSWLHRAPQAG